MATLKSFLLAALLASTPAFAQIACIQVVTTTIPFEAALSAHTTGSAACPTAFYSVDGGAGLCCASTATPRSSAGGAAACCPCGAFCTGDLVAVQTWGADATPSGSGSGSTGVGPVTITQVSSGGAEASTIVQTFSPTSSGGVVILTGTNTQNPLTIQTSTGSSGSTTIIVTSGTTSSGTSSSSSSVRASTSSTGSSQTGNSGADVGFVAPGTFITGAFVALVIGRALLLG